MLAREWLYGSRVATKYDAIVERHLKLPTAVNKHSTLAVLNTLAERIVFTDDIPTLLYDMKDNKQLTFKGVVSSARLPYDCFWLEYSTVLGVNKDDDIQSVSYGALVQSISTTAVRMYVVVGLDSSRLDEFASTVTHVLEFDEWPPICKIDDKSTLAFRVVHAFNSAKFETTRGQYALAELGTIINELIFGIFLITQPRVYSDERITHKPSHSAKRVAMGKPPLLEFRRIRLHIVKPHKHHDKVQSAVIRCITTTDDSDTESDASVRHRRYHKVMGHFRHYINTSTPHTVWIEPHYRGDPALGVTFTERQVSK
jgi:hypothetical protein